MKFIISENKLNNTILTHLELNFKPDYDWGPELFDFYRNEVEKFGNVYFYVNDFEVFCYYKQGQPKLKIEPKTLVIFEKISKDLNRWFGNRWVDVFVEWFEKNTGLEVETVIRSLEED